MYKTVWILGIIIWLLSFAILIIALTDIWPNDLLYKNRLFIGIFFLNFSALLKLSYNRFRNSRKIDK